MEKQKPHFLLVTFPAQGHINPALQFAKLLLRAGADVTFITATSAHQCLKKATVPKGINFTTFSDGYGDSFKVPDADILNYLSTFRQRGVEALSEFLDKSVVEGKQITCVVHTIIPWAAEVARKFHVPSTLLWVQPAMTFNIYYYYFNGYGEAINECEKDPSWSLELPNMPLKLKARDLPSFLLPSNHSLYAFAIPSFQEQVQQLELDDKPIILVNTFEALEVHALKAIERFNLISIGPILPSAFLNRKDPSDKSFEGDLFLEHLQTQHLSIPPGARVQHTFPEIFFYKPNLWWPNGMGKQSLYNVTIAVDVKGFGESDMWHHLFGFRKIESYVDSATGGRLFKVNGEPVFIRGGNWILSDGLLRLSKKRYQTDIKFHADMNFNMMRCWGGGLAERPEFYHFCDVYGLLVWQEFWITGDVDGRGDPISNPNGPLDHDLFLLCARDTVKLLRNHASLALWVGGNEQVPPDDINAALKHDLSLHPDFEHVNGTLMRKKIAVSDTDPSQYLDGTRVYVQGSMWDGFADGQGNFTDGPYEIQNPEDFFKDNYYNYGFNPEVGSVGMPVAATIRATMPKEGWQIPLFKKLDSGYVEEVPNQIWEYHKYIPYSKPGLVHDQILKYGTPNDLDDFCLKAQLVNYVQYRALLEGWTSHMWSKFTGVLIWKTQNPWTGLRGQFYDHLLNQTGGFYGCRSAAEPVHVQLNLATYCIEVVNTTSDELSDIAVEASVWDLEGTCPYYNVHESLTVPPKKTLTITEMKYPESQNPKPVYFLLLKLYHMSDHGILSRNFYWLHLPGGDYKLLEPYRTKNIPLKITSKVSSQDNSYEVLMKVENTSKMPNRENQLNKNIFCLKVGDDSDDALHKFSHDTTENKLQASFFQKINSCFLWESNRSRVVEINGADAGVAFFLHFSVHSSEKESKGTQL